eukprot:7378524-Heterocapsa_arctica.AAC.1
MRLRPPPALSVRTAGLRAGGEGVLREGLRRVPGLLALQRPPDSRYAQRHRSERPRLPDLLLDAGVPALVAEAA